MIMAEADITVFMLKLILIFVFSGVVIGGILLLTEFKANVKTFGLQRLGIDFGENVLASDCTSDVKGLLNETKLDAEKANYDSEKNGLSGFTCIKTAFKARTLIKTSDDGKEWNFGFDEKRKYDNSYEFPAALNSSDGSTLPALVKVAVEPSAECDSGNEGSNCYNCMQKKNCEDAGCKYSEAAGLCEPQK